MAWYRSGSISLTNGSATVTGSGTAFITNASIGEGFLGPDGRTYEITDIASNTSLTISPAYLGSTASGQAYAIAPLRGRIADLIAETSSLLTSFSDVRDGVGAGLFPNGSAATPAFRFTSDQDTGVFLASTNAIGFATGGARRAYIDGNGHLIIDGEGRIGIGTGGPNVEFVARGGAGNPVLNAAAGIAEFEIDTTQLLAVGGYGTSPFGVWLQTKQNNSGYTNNTFPLCLNPVGGAVGVGVANPTSKLHVAVPNGGDVARFDGGAGVSGYIYADSTSLGFFNTASAGAGRDGFLISNGTQVAIEIDATNIAIATSIGLLSGADNGRVLGSASLRWSTVYAGTGTINTSDEREKHWRGELSLAELRAAKRIIAELGVYQWNDAVAEKGEDGARLHFGVRAQQAFAIMEDEGLDWGRYAWACYDQWEEQTEPVVDEDGEPTGETRVTLEAGDRYGVRPDQLAFWLIAAQAKIQADLEARLAALEAA